MANANNDIKLLVDDLELSIDALSDVGKLCSIGLDD